MAHSLSRARATTHDLIFLVLAMVTHVLFSFCSGLFFWLCVGELLLVLLLFLLLLLLLLSPLLLMLHMRGNYFATAVKTRNNFQTIPATSRCRWCYWNLTPKSRHNKILLTNIKTLFVIRVDLNHTLNLPGRISSVSIFSFTPFSTQASYQDSLSWVSATL